MQTNNVGIYVNLMDSLDDIIYVDYVLQLLLIYMDKKYNKKLLVFSIVVPQMIVLILLAVLKNQHQMHTNFK